MSSIQSLPAELIELTLIFSAASGSASSISALAQTCRAFRALVYQSADQHLWREIFLTSFDDPRASRSGDFCPETDPESPSTSKAATQAAGSDSDQIFDWGAEYRLRVWSERWITSHVTQETQTREDHSATAFESDDTSRNVRALEALVSVVQTALPFPPTIVPFLPPSPEVMVLPAHLGGIDARLQLPSTPPFPIFPPVVHNSKKHTDNSDRLSSLNISWFDKVLARGLPGPLVQRLAGTQWPLGNAPYWQEDDEAARELQALGRIVCYAGFIPVPQETTPETTSQSGDTADPLSPTGSEDSIHDPVHVLSASGMLHLGADDESSETDTTQDTATADSTAPIDMSIAAQQRRARRLGRMRVYNMRYLSRARHWGPYLPVQGIPMSPRRRASHAEDDLLEPILALFANSRRSGTAHNGGTDGADEDGDEYEAGDDDEDEEMELPDGEYHIHIMAGEDSSDGESVDDEGRPAKEPHGLPPLPTPGQLRADWAYLAAARVVVEANLRDALKQDELAGLVNLDGLRQGSAPRETGDWAVRRVEKELPCEGKGKGKAKEEDTHPKRTNGASASVDELEVEEVDGWDWAGVTGVWRRCVCWMDYRDLILHNLSSEFNDPRLREAVRIVPMRLRVSHYTAPAVSEYPDRPTIHVDGETAGSGHNNLVRKIHGTVSVIADGSIRWNLFSSTEDSDSDEWVTEGIQIGGVSSAMGVLGMWTGAQHEKMDPLGPFWQWKVG